MHPCAAFSLEGPSASCCHSWLLRAQRHAARTGTRTGTRTGLRKCWAEAHEKIARMTLTIKLDRNWSSFQLANSAPPLSVTDSAIAPSARMIATAGFNGLQRKRKLNLPMGYNASSTSTSFPLVVEPLGFAELKWPIIAACTCMVARRDCYP